MYRLNRTAAMGLTHAKASRRGAEIRAQCPVHNGGEDSLSITERHGNAVWYCFAGCDGRDVGRELEARGVITRTEDPRPRRDRAEEKRREAQREERTRRWMSGIWRESALGCHRIALEWYAHRGFPAALVLPLFEPGTGDLRFHAPREWIVAPVRDRNGSIIGLHTTRLGEWVRERRGTAVRRSHGAVAGGAIRLYGTPATHLCVSEGCETAIAFRALGLTNLPVWAAISAGGIERLELPAGVERVTVLADFDGAGITAFERLRKRLHGQVAVDVYLPRTGHGTDFNDDWLATEGLRRAGTTEGRAGHEAST